MKTGQSPELRSVTRGLLARSMTPRTVQSETVNNLPLGRDMDETLRLVDAAIHAASGAGVCPAGWNPTKPDMQPNEEGVASYLAENRIL